eukprot:jgi/Chlat1/2894/Chrsp2S04659
MAAAKEAVGVAKERMACHWRVGLLRFGCLLLVLFLHARPAAAADAGVPSGADWNAASWKAAVDAAWKQLNPPERLRHPRRTIAAADLPTEFEVVDAEHSLLCYKGRLIPNVFLIGAQKAASTTVWAHLVNHNVSSGAVWSEPKEQKFFGSVPVLGYTRKQLLDAYSERMPPCHQANSTVIKYVMDGTPTYLLSLRALRQLRHVYGQELAPRIKLLAILRDPVNRSLSWFNHIGRRHFNISCNVPFSQWVEKETASAYRCMRENIAGNAPSRAYERCMQGGFKGSLYSWQLSEWFKTFPASHFHIIDHQELRDDHPKAIGKILKFLKLPAPPDLETLPPEVRNTVDKHLWCEPERSMDDRTQQLLRQFFSPLNAHLASLLSAMHIEKPQFLQLY